MRSLHVAKCHYYLSLGLVENCRASVWATHGLICFPSLATKHRSLGFLLRRDASLVILIAFTSCPSTAIGIGDVGANSIKSQTGAIHHTPMSSTRSTICFRIRAPALVALSKVWSAAGRRFFCCSSSTFCRCCAGDRGITWLRRWRSCRVMR